MAGTPLKDETRRNVDLYLGIRDLKRMKTTLVLLTIGIVIVLIIAMGRRVQSSWAHYAIIGLYSFSLLVSFSWLNTALENMFRRTENIIIPETMTRRRTAIAIIIILICLVSAFVFSGDTPVLSPAFIKEALSQIDISMPAFDMKLPDMHVDELLPPESMVRGGSPDIDLGWISVAIKIIIFILLGFAALLVIIMAATSLLSPAKASVAVRGNPFLLFFSRILLLVRAVADMMKGLFGLFVRRDYQRAKRDTSIDDTMVFSGIVDKRATRAKQRETNRVIAAFVKVIRWGKGHDVPFTRNLAPQEYLNRIERRYPLLAPSLTLIGTTFEEAIFSLNLIGETKMASYYLAAKNVLRYREKK